MHENKDKKFHADCDYGHRWGHIFLLESGWWTAERYSFEIPIDFPGEEGLKELEESEEPWGITFEHDRGKIAWYGYMVRCVKE
ncbi:MAG: hypothetical protein FJX95_07540 [Bacteroidetes bacterium]|nr:hypothetical protein [Bacteroidota bacterium]